MKNELILITVVGAQIGLWKIFNIRDYRHTVYSSKVKQNEINCWKSREGGALAPVPQSWRRQCPPVLLQVRVFTRVAMGTGFLSPYPTHPIPTGIPIRYPRQTWCLVVLQRCRATTTTTSRRRTAATSDDRTGHTCRGAVAVAPPSPPLYQRPPWQSSPPSHRRFLHATTAVFDLPTRFEWPVLGCRTLRQ